MNKQNPGIEWTHVFGPGTGRTWNAVGGCQHRCRWIMPDGTIAICYAEGVAEGLAQAAYPQGFAHHYWHPDRLAEPTGNKERLGIFIDSMSDLMGAWVPEDQIRAVLDVCWKNPQHVFQLLTKNAPRLLKFEFPQNVWVGISTPPDYFMGKRLTQEQMYRMLDVSLGVLDRVKASVRWISFEPLSWDVSPLLSENAPIEWAVIGAASRGKVYFQPEPAYVSRLLTVLDWQNVPVFFKGNLSGNPAANPWREEFPRL